MSKNTSILLGNYFDDFIKNSITAGRYKNACEVIRTGLRLLEEEVNKVIALRNAVNEGIESRYAQIFDPDKHLEELKAKKKTNG